jgi:arsenate reductase (glutaredoxin)
MNIQIFGTIKCRDTRKAQRYFRERGIPFQFVDITRKGVSKGELNSIKAAVGIDNLIDREGKTYAEKNLKYMVHDIEEEILKEPLLLRTPLVRNGRDATAGYHPDVWKAWPKQCRSGFHNNRSTAGAQMNMAVGQDSTLDLGGIPDPDRVCSMLVRKIKRSRIDQGS